MVFWKDDNSPWLPEVTLEKCSLLFNTTAGHSVFVVKIPVLTPIG
jgi:hypothetical protein